MKVASGKVDFNQCPYLSPEARAKLEEMMEPPIITISLKREDKEILLGGEKVLYRHQETFYNPTVMCIDVEDEKSIEKVRSISYKRAGETFEIDAIFVNSLTEDFLQNLKNQTLPTFVHAETPNDVLTLTEANLSNSVIVSKFDVLNTDKVKNLLKKTPHFPLGVKVSNIDEIEKVGSFFREEKIKGLFFLKDVEKKKLVYLLHEIRKRGLINKDKRFGFPIILWAGTDLSVASIGIIKYASVVVLSSTKDELLLPLFTLRQNIYTDPRRPIQVEAKLYSFGQVNKKSPLLVTTNFSLTYFTVAQEIEASQVPSYLLIINTEGTSVLTAWASDRFNAHTILQGLEKEKIEELVSHLEIVIPGYVHMLKDEIENTSPWKVTVGPKEASKIPSFLKKYIVHLDNRH